MGWRGEGGWDIKWSTCWIRSALCKNSGSPDALCHIFFLAPFFWVVNGIMTKFAVWRSPSVAVTEKTLRLQLKAVSLRQNGVLSDLDAVYSPGRIRKK